MPPFLPRKRQSSVSPANSPGPAKRAKVTADASPGSKTIFDALDDSRGSRENGKKTKNLLARLDDSDDSELSSLSSSEPDFEDVNVAKGRTAEHPDAPDDEDDEDIEFEDIATYTPIVSEAPEPSGDLTLTLTKETRISLTNPHNKKQGPSKIERQIRVATHCMHVQFLMWHNWIRNRWLNDKDVQAILLEQLGPNIQKEIQKWRNDSGIVVKEEDGKASKTKKGKGKGPSAKPPRDWGQKAQRAVGEDVNMSHGDPLFRLIKALSVYWAARFRVTAPGLRKVGYMELWKLDQELKSFAKDPHDPERHGERIQDINKLKDLAKQSEGSRDVGAQLFTALLRGLGLEARMVVSLQPVGFGWSKNEDAVDKPWKAGGSRVEMEQESGEDEQDEEAEVKSTPRKTKGKPPPRKPTKSATKSSTRSRKGVAAEPIDVDDSESGFAESDTSDDSLVDVTPTVSRRAPSKEYEQGLPPNYWVEVLSPVTNQYHAVNPFNHGNPVATNAAGLAMFEPRGAKSEAAKQVMAYIVGFSSDGTAKDVTVRYLKNHMWPGKTKGFRMPVEKVPVYNHKGKVKHTEEYDWFKVVMSSYQRGGKQRTALDEHEEATDLKAKQPEKKQVKDGEETLQYYKSSKEYVLKRHLRREEALRPSAKHVKLFVVKGKKGEADSEVKVYLRKDVVHCKSVETWHKEGREPKLGEQPMKRVPYRAATTNRKRELAEAEAASGEKMLQGLYSHEQTDWIIPPPIVDGRIPKNAYGNIDVYVPSMVPKGAVHIPRRRVKEICRKMGIDYAEAVTGFEFGARMAIPVITGVVIAEEHYEAVLEQWEQDEAERARKEDEKRTKAALGMWRKFLMGLRIVERFRDEYGEEADSGADAINPWVNSNSKAAKGSRDESDVDREIMNRKEEDMAGGFFPEGHEEEEVAQSFFPVRHDDDDEDGGGGFIVEDDASSTTNGVHTANDGQPPASRATKMSREASVEDNGDDDGMDHGTVSESAKKANKRRAVAPKATPKKQNNRGVSQRVRASSASKPAPKPRKAPRGRAKQPASSEELDETDTEESDALSDDDAEPAPRAKGKRALELVRTPSTRTQPKRQAARKSEVRSHYFAQDEGEDEDEE